MKPLLAIVVITFTAIGFTTLARAQIFDITNDPGVTPIIGLAISPAAVASGKDELGNIVVPDPSQYGYTTNGYVNGGMLRGGVNSGNSNAFPGVYAALVDGNTNTFAETEYDGFSRTATDGTAPMGYPFGSAFVGATGLQTISSSIAVTTIKLTFELDMVYGNPGGYFGDNGTGDVYVNPGSTDATLHLPSNLTLEMQVTTDGTTWTSVPFTSDYVSLMNGLDVGTGTTNLVGPTVTFTLDNPADGLNIEGMRIIGTVGGDRDDGILGIADMAIVTPEPSTYALVGLGMAGLFVVGRFARRTSAA